MVDDKDYEELKRLNPDARIRRLRELEEAKKKEIEEAEKKIEDTKKEINEAERIISESEIELNQDHEVQRTLPIDQLKVVGMENLTTPEEKEMFKIKRFKASKIEETIKEPAQQEFSPENLENIAEQTSTTISSNLDQYRLDLSEKPTEELYQEAMDVYNMAYGGDEVTREQFYQAMDLNYAIQEKERAINEGKYTSSENLERETNAIKNMVDEIIKWYTG